MYCCVAKCSGLLNLLNRILSLVTKGLPSDSPSPLALDKVEYLLHPDYATLVRPIPFLGAFVKLRRATMSFVTAIRPSAHLSVRMEKLSSHWTDFHEILYLKVFGKCAEEIHVLLKYDQNDGYFT
jgi:hypothetical protein